MHIEKKQFFRLLAGYFAMESAKIKAIESGNLLSKGTERINPSTLREFSRQLEMAHSSILWIAIAYGNTVPKELLGPIDSVDIHGFFSRKIEDDK